MIIYILYMYIWYLNVHQILEVLGLGANGPPIAKSATFQVYPYPHKRMKLSNEGHFTFIAASPDDPYVCHTQY